MIRKSVLFIMLYFFSLAAFASTDDIISQFIPSIKTHHPGNPTCDPHAAKSTDSTFCATFPPAATCNCINKGQNPDKCQSMTNIYCLMLKTYGNLTGACSMQNVTTPEECVADWNCYYDGGISTIDGKSDCDANGIRCTTDPRPTLSTCPK